MIKLFHLSSGMKNNLIPHPETSDRIFYLLDKKMNKEFKLKNYGSKE